MKTVFKLYVAAVIVLGIAAVVLTVAAKMESSKALTSKTESVAR